MISSFMSEIDPSSINLNSLPISQMSNYILYPTGSSKNCELYLAGA